MGIIMSLCATTSVRQLTLAGPDYAYLMKNWSFFTSTDGQRYLRSDELRMTLTILAGAKLEDALDAAFDESRGPWVFLRTFPHPDFLRRLVENFVASENPRNLRRILLISEKDMSEATSASFHLPQAYDTSFPCSQCTVYRTDNETCLMFVEVFHFPNRNDPSVCATVSFRMSGDHNSNCIATSDSRVEMYLSESCRAQRAPFARPSRKLFTQFDTLYGVLQEGNTDGLEKLQAVNQSWRAIIDQHKRALPRRKLLVNITLNGENPTVVTVVIARWNGEYEQVLRVLVPRSPEQLSRTLRKHLHDARVKLEFMYFERSFRHPPQDALLHWDQSKALVWTTRLLQSLKRTQVQKVTVDSDLLGIDNLPALMRAARSSCRVGTFNLVNYAVDGGFTVRQVVDLLRDPTAVASNELIVRTWTPDSTDDLSLLEDYLFSTTTPAVKLRHNRRGKEVTTRVHTYRNAHTGEALSAVRHVDRTHDNRVLFLKGYVSLDGLRNKWINDKY